SLVMKENNGYWESGDNTNSFGVDLRLPEDRPTRVTFYLPNIKVSGLLMDIWDAGGRLLENRRIDKLWDGVYESFTLKGKVRVAFHAWGWWYSVKLGGIFFDQAEGTTRGKLFAGEDYDTKAGWKGVYGRLGYFIPGDGSHLPAKVSVSFAREEIRNPLVWPAGVRHFSYRKGPVTPDNSGLGYSYDNVLLAFNALPEGKDGMLAYPPGTMPRYTGYKCTDYEYAMNPVAAQYGGGTEMWRLLAPGLNRKHFFPRQPKSEGEGPVKGGQLVIRRDGNTVVTECAIPWSELPDVKKAMDEGGTVKLSFRVNDNSAPTACMELARDRSVSKVNARAFHPDWKTHWANEVEFSFEKSNTTVFQHRIDSCSEQGGGVVRIPAGKYIIGTLRLKDNVELHLEQGAVLVGSTSPEDYTSPALIYASNARNIAITGPGTIDGQGGDPVFQKGDNGNGRPRIIHFIHCTNIRIRDITLRNSPFWVQYYSGCDTVDIRGIKVYSHCNWNNDGLDIDSRNVTVSDCTIDSDDDALCLKSETPGVACENVRVTNCRLASNCNAIKLGTASRVGFRHIFISDCAVDAASQDPIRHWRQHLEHITADRTVLAGIAVETVDGGETEDITISHIQMDHVQTPVFIRLGDRQRRSLSCMPPAVSSLKNVAISHIRATAYSRISSSVTGLPGAEIEDVYLNDIRITCPGGGTTQDAARAIPEMERSYPENRIFGNSLPASGFYFRHIQRLSVQNVDVTLRTADQRPKFVREDVTDIAGLPDARWKAGDELSWKSPGFDDKGWETIRTGSPWEEQGHAGYNGYAWYRMRFQLPASLRGAGDSVRVFIGKIDDADEVYWNGLLIGKTGSFPVDKDGYITKNYIKREYHFGHNDPRLRWNGDNVIAIRVYDGSGNGGIYPLRPFVGALSTELSQTTLVTPIYDSACILTPKPPATPRINGASVFGIRPGSPFLYRIAATGARPLRYTVRDLPAGLSVDSASGVITGVLEKEGEYHMQVDVSNAAGRAERGFTVKVGQTTALTPPMGWNSWNCWGLSVDDEKVRSSARALLDKGLADHGWNYINIDDAWQARARTPQGEIAANEKFPDMKALGDWLHGNGLKFGIYSSPGEQTCGRYTGSLGHEAQDAATYARWGVDYLKYDWCSYGKVAGADTALAAFIKPYRVMDRALRAQHRDIVYSLCQYGMKSVWKWGREVGAGCWRTTGDITDSWPSVVATGFSEAGLYPYAGPGHWNDPDMLVVGQIGWGDLHPTRLTPDEQYSHISLWCLLSAPLLIGGDISKMDDFTLGLLTNDEVIALDQDPLGQQARRVIGTDGLQVWMKELEDGTKAVGIFNMSDTPTTAVVSWDSLGVQRDQLVRDCWRQKELGSYAEVFTTALAAHGVCLIKITPKHRPAPIIANFFSQPLAQSKKAY
ncbi:MAG: putative Ig domain-containing protein, partial [Bacteroidetes bacterium]|nr:putative Ig domain-containing protein [Bacteroidota bacterium]